MSWRPRCGGSPFGSEYDHWRVSHAALAVARLVLAGVHMEGVGVYLWAPWVRLLWMAILGSFIAVIAYVRVVNPWRLLRRPGAVVEVRPERGHAWTLAAARQRPSTRQRITALNASITTRTMEAMATGTPHSSRSTGPTCRMRCISGMCIDATWTPSAATTPNTRIGLRVSGTRNTDSRSE